MQENREIDSISCTKTGWLCLDFANTVDWHASSHPEEKLTGYPELVEWCKQVGIVSTTEANSLLAKFKKTPVEAQAKLREAIELREAIYHTFSNVVHGLPVRAVDLAIMNKAIADILSHSKLLPGDKGFSWGWDSNPDNPNFILWPIVRSAVELMTSEALQRVGQCADEQGCGWLFWDNSRNRSRQWCDMRDCGNRAKARRHYQKVRN